jgi:hypothetical protein
MAATTASQGTGSRFGSPLLGFRTGWPIHNSRMRVSFEMPDFCATKVGWTRLIAWIVPWNQVKWRELIPQATEKCITQLHFLMSGEIVFKGLSTWQFSIIRNRWVLYRVFTSIVILYRISQQLINIVAVSPTLFSVVDIFSFFDEKSATWICTK